MQSDWQKSFELMLQSEGGFTDDPRDPGNHLPDGRPGCTNFGVTQTAWEEYVGHKVSIQDMRDLTLEQINPFYKRRYWDVVRGDELPAGISYLCFDFAVNAGGGRSIKTLQTAVGVTPDGGFGPLTMTAVQAVDPVELIERFSQAKEDFYRSLNTFATFGKGWLNRVADVKVKASLMLA
jgi:lysozyme family protein